MTSPAGDAIDDFDAPVLGTEADRCPYPRPFPANFADCPAYQAVTFHAADSMNRPLGTRLTCRHLVTGVDPARRGRFYPRCALGSAEERLRWVALVSPAKLEVVRAIQEEFDRFSWQHREELVEAKARLMASPGEEQLRTELERLLDSFLGAIGMFLSEREERLGEVGLPADALMLLIEEWSRAWVTSRRTGSARGGEPLQAFDPVARAFVAPAVNDAREAEAAEVLLDDGRVRVTSIESSPRLIRLAGEVDASNSERLGEALAALAGAADDVEVDLSGILFCDLSGMRQLVRTAQSLGEGRRLVVRGIPEDLNRALRLVGWADLPSFEIVAGMPA